MTKWLKKTFVTLITVLTFGMFSPFQAVQANDEPVEKTSKNDAFESKQSQSVQKEKFDLSYHETNQKQSPKQQFLQTAIEIGQQQSWQKFGDRIGPVIENEFETIILPKIEKAIMEVTEQFNDEDIPHLTISQKPGTGKSEKIFHIYNEKTGKDIIRFHVRRDLRPLEGYWFNFHYHTFHDHYQTHHELGDIFWDKNTPPNWPH
jgi:hypothetical protein